MGVDRVDARTVHRELTANVLSSDRPSAPSLRLLHRLGMFSHWEDEPAEVLAELHRGLAPEDDEDRVFALAELSFLHGERSGDRRHMLASAVYAYAFIFPGDAGRSPEPFDPRLRLAIDLYNRALTSGLVSPDSDQLSLASGRFELPFGSLDVVSAVPDFAWAGYRLTNFVSAADLRVRGLRNRYRRRGIGAPLAASLADPATSEAQPAGHQRIPARMRVPVTALLRLDASRRALVRGQLSGTLELFSPDDALGVTIDGRVVPLEFETTSSLALGLEGASVWDFERQGFLFGDRRFRASEFPDGLLMLHPYRPGRIPAVLVHGTASSPARWAEMINELENDPRIRQRYQIWLFIYNTGNPVAVSGALLREALRGTLAELDPEERDPALRSMVVIGHSQGGLLAKLTAVDSGTHFWENISEAPLEDLDLTPETRELLERALFVKPLPFVKRLIFIATPHRGSYLTAIRFAGLSPASWVRGLIEVPGYIKGAVSEIVGQSEDVRLRRRLDRVPTSIDNMTPGNPFLQTLAELPVVPGVTTHSIIPVRGSGPPEEGNDGVVKYTSAHIDGVASELVVRSGHSTQAEPATIEETRRILLEHAGPP